jgi:hypothetical protein
MRYAAPELAGVADAIRSIEATRVHYASRWRGSVAARGARAAREEQDYLMRLWHWKACMWDTGAARFSDQIERAIKFGIYDPRL